MRSPPESVHRSAVPARGFTPTSRAGAPVARTSDALRLRDSRVVSLSSPFGPSRRMKLPRFGSGPARLLRSLLRPRLTSRSALTLAFPRRPFRREARSPQVRTLSFTARSPGLRRLSLGHRSFADPCPLAPLVGASYPVSVRRPAVSLPASFPRSVALAQLRFASIGMTSSRSDFHQQDSAHAGRTRKGR